MYMCAVCGAQTMLVISGIPICSKCEETALRDPRPVYAVVSGDCDECARLMAEYEQSVREFDRKTQAMRGPWKTPSEYQALKSIVDKERQNAEDARFALERHELSHTKRETLSAGR